MWIRHPSTYCHIFIEIANKFFFSKIEVPFFRDISKTNSDVNDFFNYVENAKSPNFLEFNPLCGSSNKTWQYTAGYPTYPVYFYIFYGLFTNSEKTRYDKSCFELNTYFRFDMKTTKNTKVDLPVLTNIIYFANYRKTKIWDILSQYRRLTLTSGLTGNVIFTIKIHGDIC